MSTRALSTAYAFDGVKTISLESLPPDAWKYLTGHDPDSSATTPEAVYAAVAWIYRGVNLRARALADIPWVILKGETEIASSEESAIPAELPWLRKMKALLLTTELDLCMAGAAYWKRDYNLARTLAYRRMLPRTITPVFDSEAGLRGFIRGVSGQKIELTVEDLVYWWLPSVTSELGPGDAPVKVALAAAGMLTNVDVFGQGFFARGAVNMTLLSVEGNPSDVEMKRLQTWWKRLISGVRKAWDSVAIKATIKPVVLGSPPKDLAMVELTSQKREDICVALGIPPALLLPGPRANLSEKSDMFTFTIDTLLPEAEIIEEGLNEQVFRPLGLEFKFQSSKLEVIEAHDQEKAFALIAAAQVGLISIEEWRQTMDLTPKAAAGDTFVQVQPNVAHGSNQQAAAQVAQIGAGGMAGAAAGESAQVTRSADLARWEAKALKALKAGKSANVPFETDAVDGEEQTLIRLALAEASSPAEVRSAINQTPDLHKTGVPTHKADPLLPFKAKKPAPLPGHDGADAERLTLERRHQRTIAAALKRQLDAALPPGTNESTVFGWEQRVADAGQPLRDALYALLHDGAMLGADVGRRAGETVMGVSPKAIALDPSVGLGGTDWTLVNAAALDWASQHAGELVSGINETTLTVLRAALAEWTANTLTFEQLVAQLAPSFGPVRAATIATTEITKAFAEGSIAAWKASGVIAQRQFATANDELVCPLCGPHADEIVAMDDSAVAIPQHPNCRCWWRPYVGTDG